MEADLVAEALEAPHPRRQIGVAPVRGRMEDEVRRPEAARVLEPRELERALEARVHVVPQRQVNGAPGKLP